MSPLAVSVGKVLPLAAGLPLADSDKGKGSPIGLFVVLILVVATYLLYRSMSRHLRRVPERFPGYQAGSDAAGTTDAGPATPEAAGAGGPSGTEDAAGEGTGPATPAAGTGSRFGPESGERTRPS